MTGQVDGEAPEQTYEPDRLPLSPLDAIQDGLRRQLSELADGDVISSAAYGVLLPDLLDATRMAFEAGQTMGIPLKEAAASEVVAMRAGKTAVARSRK